MSIAGLPITKSEQLSFQQNVEREFVFVTPSEVARSVDKPTGTRAKRVSADSVPSWLQCCIDGCKNKIERAGVCGIHDATMNKGSQTHKVGGEQKKMDAKEYPPTQTRKKGGVYSARGAKTSSKICCIEGCSNKVKRGAVCSIHDVAESPTGVAFDFDEGEDQGQSNFLSDYYEEMYD